MRSSEAARRLDRAAPDFEQQFAALIDARRGLGEDVDAAVAAIVADVRKRGDDALVDLTCRFDKVELTPATLRLSREEIDEAAASCSTTDLAALGEAARRIEGYHQRQKPLDERFTDATGVELGHRWTPIDAVGLYVPGGTASYPSSVLMSAIPARLAGVRRIVMTTPAASIKSSPLVLAAAKLAGVTEIYRVGGAQAVAALAYGTASIAAVDKIVGPGNAYVASAKKQVFGAVGIDTIAGPSEILVVADGANDPGWIAADLLSQAEHDPDSQAILITDDAAFADAVAASVEAELRILERGSTARESWRRFGAIITVRSFDEAVPLVDALAPEHLEVAMDGADAFAAKVAHAGAIFLGRYTPEAVGDYIAGTNHVLPTARSARFASGLSVLDFMKRTSIVRCDAASLGAIGPAAVTLAKAEGLTAHARSVSVRLNR